MSMNRFVQFRNLVGTERRLYATVVSIGPNGTTMVRTPENRTLQAKGQGYGIGQPVFITIPAGGRPTIDRQAPDLPTHLFANL